MTDHRKGNSFFSDAIMSTPQSSFVPARILFSLASLCAAFFLLMNAPQAAPPSDQTFSEVTVSRVVPDASQSEQLRDLEADFVRQLILDATDAGLDLTDANAVAEELRPYYPDLFLQGDGPTDLEYKHVWDELFGWVRICVEIETLILDSPMEINPIVISIHNGMTLN